MTDKKTYGQQLLDHQSKNLELESDVIEYRREMEPDILRKIYNTITEAKTKPLYTNRNFYVVMLIKKERFGDTPRTLIFARRSCPTPTYKQCVWKYHNNSDHLEFLWSIPDIILYYHILRNKHKYLVDKECSDLTKFVILMESGELLEWVKHENGEKVDAVIKISKENEC
jgi:hypothetical protein